MENFNIFIPLFNIEIDETLLEKEFICGYKILKSNDILYNINQYIFAMEPFTNSFIRDITQNGANKILMHPYAKYVLFKQIIIPDNDTELYKEKEKIKNEIDDIILAFRLASDGYIQVNNCYFIANGHSAFTMMKSSSQIENICISHRSRQNNLLVENLYHLSCKLFKDIKEQFNIIKEVKNDNTNIAMDYLHKCYNTNTPYDRIINLAIILESTMLAGRNEELNYRLFLRTSALLWRDVKELLETFYSIRSDIVHNGIIQERSSKKKNKKDVYDRISKIISIERKDKTELIFYFVKDHIEPLIREILRKTNSIFIENSSINTYEELNSQIEMFIMQKITCGIKIDT